jgi:excisionase family DNA binding protein
MPSLECQRLSPQRLAWIMGVSVKTVERWLKDKEIPYFKVGHVIRMEPEDVLAFIQRHRYQARRTAARSVQCAERGEGADFWVRIERLIKGEIDGRLVLRTGTNVSASAEEAA